MCFEIKKHFKKQPLPHFQTPSNLLGMEKKNKEKILNFKKKPITSKLFMSQQVFFAPIFSWVMQYYYY